MYDIDYTFESSSNQSRSIIDHVFLSSNLTELVSSITCEHSPENMSDHSPISIDLELRVAVIDKPLVTTVKLLWPCASLTCVEQYRNRVENLLISSPLRISECNDAMCGEAMRELQEYSDFLVDSCIEAS